MTDALTDAVFEVLEAQNDALLEVLPAESSARHKLQTKLIGADLVRRYVSSSPPDKSKTDWPNLLTLVVPFLTLLAAIVATLLGVDWKAILL